MSFWRVVKWIFLSSIVLLLLWNMWIFAHVWWWRSHNPDNTQFMTEQLERLRADDPDAQLSQQWVSYDHISDNLKSALIAAEDAKFLEHDGFDWEGIETAWEKDLKKHRIVAGGSTISQQLAKNLFLSSKRTPWRKAEEAIITVMLEKTLDKQRIFEIYLNVIEWGNGVFGAEAAAHHYYHTSAARLTAYQAAKLAAMVPDPRYFDTHRSDRKLLRKTGIIARRLSYADFP